jgi:hypothetical protein
MLTIRQHHETPILSAASMSALLCPAFASLLDVGTNGLLKLFLFGTTQFGRGLILLMIGGQMVSATENASPFVPTNRWPLWCRRRLVCVSLTCASNP